jgi:hypothetical protein
LTYGARWEVDPPPKGVDGTDIYTITNLDTPANFSWAPKGTPLFKTRYGNIAPRVGLTYALSQRPGLETALRGGFGMFYDLGFGSAADALGFDPYSRTVLLTNVKYPADPSLIKPPPFALTASGARVLAFDPNIKLPRIYQWNATIEQGLGRSQTLSLAYVGAIGRDLIREERLNNPNPTFLFVNINRNAATSDYHALQAQFIRRMSRGVQVLASYTWSDSIDNASNDSSINTPGEKISSQIDRGSSDFDIRDSISAAVSYNIPRMDRLGKPIAAVLQDWSLDIMFRARTAPPLNITYSRDLGYGSYSFRPDLVAGVPVYLDDATAGGGKLLNPAAFSVPTELRPGTLPRLLRAFGANQVDFAVNRSFHLTERLTLQWRTEFFNLFNHPNFGMEDGSLGSVTGATLSMNPNFGKSTEMLGRSLGTGGGAGGFDPLYQIGGPRSIQMSLRLQF